MKFSKLWHVVLGVVLIFWGVVSMGWVTFDAAGDIVAIGAIVAGALLIFDK